MHLAAGQAAMHRRYVGRRTVQRLGVVVSLLWPLAFFAGVAVVMTWPLALRIGAQIPADGGTDMLVHQWTFWWLEQSLLSGQDPYFTTLLAFPNGTSLTSHNIAWLNFALWLPWALAYSSVAATGITYLVIFTFNAYAMYLFALDQVRLKAAAVVAGLIFGFFPYTLSDAGHVNFLLIGWLPLALIYLDRAVRRGRVRDGVLAGLFLALLGITRWQMLIMAAIVGGLFVLYRLIACRRLRAWPTWKALLIAGGVMGLLLAPLLLPVLYEQLTRRYADDLLIYEPAFSADLLGYVVPNVHQALYRWLTQGLPQALQFTSQEVSFLGYTVLALAVIGIALRARKAAIWLGISLVLVVLALGPVVTVGQQALAWLPTPYRLIEDTFFNQLVRKPWRYNTLLGLPLAMLAAYGVTAIRQRLGSRRSAIVVGLCAALLLAEYWIAPYPLATITVPAWYEQLAADPDEYGILGIPIGSRLADKYYMAYQTVHGKPIVGGHVSRPPRESIAYLNGSNFLLDMLERREMDPATVDVTHQLRYLADANVRYLVLHKNLATEDQIKAWQDWLTIQPAHEDDMVVVYSTRPQAGVDFTIDRPLTAGLGVIDSSVDPDGVDQGDLLAVDIRFGCNAAQTTDYDACVRLLDESGAPAQESCAPISPAWPTSRWQPGEVARYAQAMRVAPDLAPGRYHVQVMLRDGATGDLVGNAAALGRLEVRAIARSFEAPAPQHPLDVTVGSAIGLRGYDVAQAGDKLNLTLYWQATGRIDRAYKVFVHLVDPANGMILVQSDAEPRNWRYPTTWWQPGEYVADTVELPLTGPVPPGAFLRVGMYDAASGERLPLAEQGQALPDSVINLPVE